MRVSLEFEMPDDEWDFTLVINRNEMFDALTEVLQYCRNELKYSSPSTETVEALEHIRDLIWQECSDERLGLP